MITQKSRYALRALLFLTKQSQGTPVRIAEIARHECIPIKYLEAILLELQRHGIVHSRRGRLGGYAISRSPNGISFADILNITEGAIAQSPCVDGTPGHHCNDCARESECAIRLAMLSAREALMTIFELQRLDDAARTRSAANQKTRPSLRWVSVPLR